MKHATTQNTGLTCEVLVFDRYIFGPTQSHILREKHLHSLMDKHLPSLFIEATIESFQRLDRSS